MEDLVANLRLIDSSELPDGDDDVILHPCDHALVSVIEGMATDVLIDEEGTPNYAQMDWLYHTHGYFVFPGERDRFGWLTGCLRTKKGIIIFG